MRNCCVHCRTESGLSKGENAMNQIGIELRSTSFDLTKPLAAMAERAKQDGFEFYYTRYIAEDVFELELRRDYIGVKTKISSEYMNKYVPQSCVEGVLMGEYDRMAYMLGAVTGCNSAPEDLR